MIEGTADPRFARLREAFASCVADGLETGGAVAVYADGRLVADLWGGHADAAMTRPWQKDTLVNVWSVTKGVMALAVAMAVERGKLAYDKPIATWWREFGRNGKETIDLDLVMSHRAGLNGLAVPLDTGQLLRWTPYVDALAAMAPLYPPGSVCAYHALTYGHLTGEPLRRADGRSPGRIVAEDIAGPLGVSFHIGLPEAEDHHAAEMIAGPGTNDWLDMVLASPCPESCANPRPDALAPNTRAWRAAEIPGGNGHGNARSLATIYGTLAAGGGSLLSKSVLAEATRQRFSGDDVSFGLPSTWAAGFRLGDPDAGPKASPRAFGHAGWGGSIAFADPDAGIGFAYVTRHMRGFETLDPRRERLSNAVYEALGT